MLRCPQPATIARKRKVAINQPPHGKRRSAARGCTCYTIKNLPKTADNSRIIPSSRSSLLFSKLFRHYRRMPWPGTNTTSRTGNGGLDFIISKITPGHNDHYCHFVACNLPQIPNELRSVVLFIVFIISRCWISYALV